MYGKLDFYALYITFLFVLFVLLCGITHSFSPFQYVMNLEDSNTLLNLKSFFLFLAGITSLFTAIVGFKFFPYIIRKLEEYELSKIETNQLLEIVENCMESITILNSNLIFLKGNYISQSYFGKDYIGRSILEFIWDSDDLSKFKQAIEHSVCSYSGYKDIVIEYRVYSTNNKSEFLWCESSIRKRNSLSDPSKIEYTVITRNVSERRAKEEILTVIEKQAEQDRINKSKLIYITCVAHDLKTPLQSFIFSLDLLKKTILDQEQLDILLQSEMSAQLMRFTIDQAMYIGKAIGGNKITPRITSNSLNETICKIKSIAESYASKIPVNYYISSEVYDIILTDHEWVLQILLNLLSNSFKHTEMGRIDVNIKIINSVTKSMILFEVYDTGIGIDENKLLSIFEPFTQGQKDETTGTGLGLFSVRSRVEALLGEYGVDNNSLQKGCTFWFTIPYKPDRIYPDINELNIILSPSPLRPFHSFQLQVAIIDDTPTIRKLLRKVLLDLGFVVVDCYENGAQGLEAMKNKAYDFVFSDIQMPIMSGPEVRNIKYLIIIVIKCYKIRAINRYIWLNILYLIYLLYR